MNVHFQLALAASFAVFYSTYLIWPRWWWAWQRKKSGIPFGDGPSKKELFALRRYGAISAAICVALFILGLRWV
jgi:hypothetical protein